MRLVPSISLWNSSSEKVTLRMRGANLPASTSATVASYCGAVDRLPFHDVAGAEEHHEVAQILDLLLRVVDRHRRDAEHLVAAGAAHRIDAAEAAAVADRQLGRVGARAQILRHLDLPLAVDHLVEERQAGHEAHHRDEPGRAGMRLHEAVDAVEVVDARGVFDVGALRVLVALAEAHQGLVGPGIVVEDRDLDDAGLQHRIRLVRALLQPLQLGQHVVRADLVRIELDLERGVGRADLGDALDLGVAHGVGHGEALEEGLQRHLLAHLDEDVLVAAKGISVAHLAATSLACSGPASARRDPFCSSQRSSQRVSKRAATTAASDASA